MPKVDLGTKRICPSCHQPFYDLKKSPAVCPHCSHSFNPDDVLRGRRQKAPAPEPPKPEKAKPAEAAEGELPEVEEAAEDGEEALIEDTSDLGEGDDVTEVIEGSVDETANREER